MTQLLRLKAYEMSRPEMGTQQLDDLTFSFFVAHDDLLARPQAQHPAEMMGVVVREDGMGGVIDEDLGRCGGAHAGA